MKSPLKECTSLRKNDKVFEGRRKGGETRQWGKWGHLTSGLAEDPDRLLEGIDAFLGGGGNLALDEECQ